MILLGFALLPPVSPVHVTSPYCEERPNPLDGGKTCRPHRAVDLRASVGQPVYASGSGVVRKSYYSTGDPFKVGDARKRIYSYGERVVIDHPGSPSATSTYNHLSRRMVHQGDIVTAGQLIGLAGESGDCRGAHLHFELYVGGQMVDPMLYLAPRVPEKPIPNT